MYDGRPGAGYLWGTWNCCHISVLCSSFLVSTQYPVSRPSVALASNARLVCNKASLISDLNVNERAILVCTTEI